MLTPNASGSARRSRWSWIWRALAVLCLVFVVDLLGSAVVRQIRTIRTERQTVEAELAQEPYRGTDWARAYWEELGAYDEQWEPYIVWRVRDMKGQFINVEHGVRKTYQGPTRPGVRRQLVFVFGGSAT